MSNDDDFCGNTPAGGTGIRDSGYAPESVCAVKRSAQVAGYTEAGQKDLCY